MDFHLTDEQQMIVNNTKKIAKKYDRAYWVKNHEQGTFTEEMWQEFAKVGILGITVPEEYGGLGLGITEIALVEEELGNHGVPLLMLIVGPALSVITIAKHGSEEIKKRFLPPTVTGETKFCFGITEPNAGTNTFNIQTFAKDEGNHYVLNGQKVFISGADVSDYMLLVTRTASLDQHNRTHGITLMIVDMKSDGITLNEVDTQIVHPEKQFLVFFDNVIVPKENVVGDPGKGIRSLFDGLNPERILVAAMSAGMGRYALNKGVSYANEREVFGRPIGAHQGLQHPLALAKSHLELASLMMRKAAWVYDNGGNAGEFANVAKLAAADAAVEACDIAIQVHGGNGFTKEYDLMNIYSMCRVMKTAPVSREMILNYIGEHVLELPKSY
jgi:acyl-CoA dehydrogenase